MKVIYNKLIPVKGFSAINLFGVIFAREEYKQLTPLTLRHEAIHSAQMRELLWVGFYLAYFLEWLYRLCTTKNAYRKISFEVEAYANQGNKKYLEKRKLFAQWRKR